MADNNNRGSSDAFRRRQEARRRREPQTIDAKAQDITTSPLPDPSEPVPPQSDPVGEAARVSEADPVSEAPLAAETPSPEVTARITPDAQIDAHHAVVPPPPEVSTETDSPVETGTDRAAAMADSASVADPVTRLDPLADIAHPIDAAPTAGSGSAAGRPVEPLAAEEEGHPAEPLTSGGPVPISEFVRTPQPEAAEPVPSISAEPGADTSHRSDIEVAEPGLASPEPTSESVDAPRESAAAPGEAALPASGASASHASPSAFDAAWNSAQPFSDPVRSRETSDRFGGTAPTGPAGMGPAPAAPAPAGVVAGLGGQRSVLPAALAALAVLVIAGLAGIYYGTQLGNSAELAAKVDALTQRVATLEARPAASTSAVDLGALQTRSSALDGDMAALKTAVADLAAKLEQTTQAEAQTSGRLAALEQHAAATPVPPPAATAESSPPPAGTAESNPPPVAAGEASPPPAEQPPAVPAPATSPEIASPADKAPGEPGPAPVASAPPAAVPPEPGVGTAELAALTGKVEDLGRRLAALPTEVPAPTDLAPLQARIADLATRLEDQQAAVAALPRLDEARLDTRLTGLDQKIDATGRQIADVSAAVAAIPKLDLAPLQASIAEVDGRLKPVEAALAAPKSGDQVTEARAVGSSEESRAAPLAVVAGAIARALDDGRPFEPELDALHGLGIEDAALGPLPVLAGPGAPTAETLRDRWADIQSKVLTAAGPKTGDSVLDRFAAGARTLVQVRQVGTAPGDDPGAASARIGAALDRGDIADALGEWAKLPEASRTASQGWADAARSRLEADASVRALLVRAIAALAPPKN